MASLEYSKSMKIKNKVLKEDDILLLAKTVQDQFEENTWRHDITVCFDDNSQIKGKDMDIFLANEFKRRQCKSINIAYASKDLDKSCKISLKNAALGWCESEIEVESTDQVWYESMFKRLETIIDEIEPQKKFMNHPYILATLLSAVEAFIFVMALNSMIEIEETIGYQTLLTGCCMMPLILINSALVDMLSKAYPSVEFAFGPMHRNTSFKIKRIIGVFIPFLMDVLFFVLGLLA